MVQSVLGQVAQLTSQAGGRAPPPAPPTARASGLAAEGAALGFDVDVPPPAAAAAPEQTPAGGKSGSFWGSLFAAKRQVSKQPPATPAVPAQAPQSENPYLSAVNSEADEGGSQAGGPNPYLTDNGLTRLARQPEFVAAPRGSFVAHATQVKQSVSPYLDAVAELR